MTHNIIVLGGYGIFGQRICRALARDELLHVVVTGRHGEPARQLVTEILNTWPSANISSAILDVTTPDLANRLQQLKAETVIHTCGPFQHQNYAVARACIDSGIHYIDLADGRDFVSGFSELHEAACRHDVLAVTGASTVPALSSAVVDTLQSEFKLLQNINIGINPGNQTPRGLATVKSILSYCGKPFRVWRNNSWKSVHGWQGLHRKLYPSPMGKRWLGHCDVPDLDLFPKRYPSVHSVQFFAGLELSILHIGTWVLSWLSRIGLVENWGRHAPMLKRLSEYFEGWGSAQGGMHVQLEGLGHDNKPKCLSWFLLADSGDGPQIPCTASVVITRKIARSQIRQRGAMPCMGLFTLNEFIAALDGFDVQQSVVIETL
jgi:hypothetical protein